METNYPDLFPQPYQEQQMQQQTSTTISPGFGLYKLYVLPDESVFVDDFQNLAKGVLRLKNFTLKVKKEVKKEPTPLPIYEEKIEIQHSSRTHTRVSVTRVETIYEPIRVEYSSGIWTMMEFAIECLKMWRQLTPAQVNVDVTLHTNEKSTGKSSSPKAKDNLRQYVQLNCSLMQT